MKASRELDDTLVCDLLRLIRHKLLGPGAARDPPTAITTNGGDTMDGTAAAHSLHNQQHHRESSCASQRPGQQLLHPAESISQHVCATAIPLDPSPGVLSAKLVVPVDGPGEDEQQHAALFLGVIDWLQPYNMRKKLEHRLKAMYLEGSSISVCDPSSYANRFMSLMKNVFVDAVDDDGTRVQ